MSTDKNRFISITPNREVNFTDEGRNQYGWRFKKVGICIDSIESDIDFLRAINESRIHLNASLVRIPSNIIKHVEKDMLWALVKGDNEKLAELEKLLDKKNKIRIVK